MKRAPFLCKQSPDRTLEVVILAGSLACLSVAQGMLPQWNHRPVDFGGVTAPFNLRQPVIISTFQQPELVELAGAIRILLERWHIRAEIRIDAFDSFNSQPRPLRISGSATLCSIPFRFRRFWNGWRPPRC